MLKCTDEFPDWSENTESGEKIPHYDETYNEYF